MTMPMIQRREIEAKILRHVYDVMKERHGATEAKAVVGAAVRAASIAQAAEFAEAEPNGTDLATFTALYRHWTAEDALEIETIASTDRELHFNVTRCRYQEMYRAMGLEEIGHLLSCQRDGTFCEGYDPRIKLTRTQTLMQGASHCDFRYSFDPGEGRSATATPEGQKTIR